MRLRDATIFLFIFSVLLANPAFVELVSFRVAGWNMESGNSSAELLKQQLGEKQDVEVWRLSEVRNAQALDAYELGTEIGEAANYEAIASTTGSGDRLAIIYNTVRLEQAKSLNEWVAFQDVAILTVGDYNFDSHIDFGDAGRRDAGYDALTADDRWIWLRRIIEADRNTGRRATNTKGANEQMSN